jgi:hypothetical protein
LHSHIHIIFDDPLVDVADDRLYDAELLKELAARVEDLLIEDLVGLGELLTVVTGRAGGLVDLTKPLYLVEEALAGALAVFRVQVILLIRPLLQVVTHHNRVLKKKEV